MHQDLLVPDQNVEHIHTSCLRKPCQTPHQLLRIASKTAPQLVQEAIQLEYKFKLPGGPLLDLL